MARPQAQAVAVVVRSEEHTSELQSLTNLVCRLLLAKNKRPGRPPPLSGSTTSLASGPLVVRVDLAVLAHHQLDRRLHHPGASAIDAQPVDTERAPHR